MKYLVFILFFAITILAADNFPIMMQIKTDLNIPEDFRGGVEEGLTQNGYSLVSEEIQKEALKEQATQRKKECYDESCLVDTGKMLAAKGLFLVEVTKKSDKLYLFKTKYIDFETGTTQKIKQDYFKFDLSDFEELSKFGKNIIQNMFGKIETKDVMKEVKTKDTSNEKAVKNGEIEIKTKIKEEKNVEKFKIEFVTIPSNVEVYDSDNNLLGETPFFMNLPKGFLKFSFEKKGFEKLEREIHVKQNEKIEISLAEKIYNFKINSNISGAKVFIDNKEKGVTPFEIKLKEGIYSIKLEKEEYDTYFEEIPVKKDGEKLITLNKNIFEIKITSNVEDSKVYIDGVLKGKAPYNVKLSKGKHKIKLTKDDFGDKEKEFEINKDETISFELYEKGKDGSGEIDYSGGSKVVAGKGKVSFFIPTGWAKQDGSNMWVDKAIVSSANIQVETSDIDMEEYLEVASTDMKAVFPFYKERIKEIKTINGREMAVLLGDIKMDNKDMTFYSVTMNIDGTKYRLTTGGLKSEFEKNKATFDKIVNSYKEE